MRGAAGHRIKYLGLVLALLLQADFSLPVSAWPAEDSQQAFTEFSETRLLRQHLIAASPTDEDGEKIPLILIHGVTPDPATQYNWSGFLSLAAQEPLFQKRYQVWLFRYEPRESVRHNGTVLQAVLRTFIRRHAGQGERPIRVVALSLGGLIVREALVEAPDLAERIDRVIALAVPFHGTPLANPDWFRLQLKQASLFSPVRLGAGLAYRLARQKVPAFATDFCWDDFDHAIPQGVSQPCRSLGAALEASEAGKIITYAGFSGADGQEATWLQDYLGYPKPDPEEPFGLNAKTRRLRPLSRHHLMRMAGDALGEIPLSAEAELSAYPPLMGFNDGLSPISSQLWLGRFLPGNTPTAISLSRQWASILQLKSSRHARLFRGLDHRDWLANKTRLQGNKLPDLLHPEEPPRSLFEWLLLDLQ